MENNANAGNTTARIQRTLNELLQDRRNPPDAALDKVDAIAMDAARSLGTVAWEVVQKARQVQEGGRYLPHEVSIAVRESIPQASAPVLKGFVDRVGAELGSDASGRSVSAHMDEVMAALEEDGYLATMIACDESYALMHGTGPNTPTSRTNPNPLHIKFKDGSLTEKDLQDEVVNRVAIFTERLRRPAQPFASQPSAPGRTRG